MALPRSLRDRTLAYGSRSRTAEPASVSPEPEPDAAAWHEGTRHGRCAEPVRFAERDAPRPCCLPWAHRVRGAGGSPPGGHRTAAETVPAAASAGCLPWPASPGWWRPRRRARLTPGQRRPRTAAVRPGGRAAPDRPGGQRRGPVRRRRPPACRVARGGGVLFIGATVMVGVVTATLNLDTSVAFLTPFWCTRPGAGAAARPRCCTAACCCPMRGRVPARLEPDQPDRARALSPRRGRVPRPHVGAGAGRPGGDRRGGGRLRAPRAADECRDLARPTGQCWASG